MEQENEQQEVVEETLPVEETTEEVVEEAEEAQEVTEESEDDSVSISKTELTKLKRKAIAYDSNKTAKPTPKVAINDVDRLERMELRQEGYSKDEVEEIMSLGGTKVLNSKIVQAAIEFSRAKERSKNASQSLNSKSPVYKKFSQDDLSKMSSKDMEKILRE